MTVMLPDSVLAATRQWQLARLDGYGEIHRPTTTPTPTGGQSVVWTPVVTGLRLGVAPGPSGQGQEQQLIAERFGSAVGYYILLPAGTDVRPEDRIYQTLPFVRTFEVLAIPNKQISFETLRRVLGVVVG